MTVARREENFFFFYFSHHIIVKSSKCQPRCNITIYWKGIDLLGYGGDDILFSSTKNNDTFTSNQIYLSLVYINELHLKHKMKHNFRIAASFVFCTNVSYGFSPKIQCEMLQSNFPFHNLFKISRLFKEMITYIFEYPG